MTQLLCNSSYQQLGDTHNFGRFVFSKNEYFLKKPRCCLLEKIFLTENNFRNFLFDILSIDVPAIQSLSLKFELLQKEKAWIISKVPAPESDCAVNWVLQGKIIALCHWFGIDDLHYENLRWFKVNDQRIKYPIDIESCFKRFSLLSQQHLVPQNDFLCDQYGLKDVFSELKNFSQLLELIESYSQSIQALDKKSKLILNHILNFSDFKNAKYRVIVRATKVYNDYLRYEKNPQLPFSQDEKDQLQRGDIPYFFTNSSFNYIYSMDKNLRSVKTKTIDINKLEIFQTFFKQIKMPLNCQKYAVSQLLKYGLNFIPLDELLYSSKIIQKEDSHYIVEIKGLDPFICKI